MYVNSVQPAQLNRIRFASTPAKSTPKQEAKPEPAPRDRRFVQEGPAVERYKLDQYRDLARKQARTPGGVDPEVLAQIASLEKRAG